MKWQSVELLWQLSVKSLKVQYRSLVLGFLWAFMMPLCMVVIFKFVFSVIFRIATPGYSFYIYLITGVFPWQFTHCALASATMSVLDHQQVIGDTPFQRECLPVATVLAHLINFIPSIIIVIGALCITAYISCYILLLPLVIIMHMCLLIGMALVTSSLQVFSRDVRYMVDIFLMASFYLAPIVYPLSLVQEHVSNAVFKVYLCNPFVGLITLYRLCLLNDYADTVPPEMGMFIIVGIPLIASVLMLFAGWIVFKNTKKHFSDYVQQ